jgi:hypothetical protein
MFLRRGMLPAGVLTGVLRSALVDEICNLPLVAGAALSSTDCNCEVSTTQKVGRFADELRCLVWGSEAGRIEPGEGSDPALGERATVVPKVTAFELPRLSTNGGGDAPFKGCVFAPVPAKVPVVVSLPPEPL